MLLRCRVALCCSSAAAVERMKFRRDRASGAKRGRRKHTQVGLPLGGQLLCLSDEQLARNGLVVLPRRLCASAWSVGSGATGAEQDECSSHTRWLGCGPLRRSVAVRLHQKSMAVHQMLLPACADVCRYTQPRNRWQLPSIKYLTWNPDAFQTLSTGKRMSGWTPSMAIALGLRNIPTLLLCSAVTSAPPFYAPFPAPQPQPPLSLLPPLLVQSSSKRTGRVHTFKHLRTRLQVDIIIIMQHGLGQAWALPSFEVCWGFQENFTTVAASVCLPWSWSSRARRRAHRTPHQSGAKQVPKTPRLRLTGPGQPGRTKSPCSCDFAGAQCVHARSFLFWALLC